MRHLFQDTKQTRISSVCKRTSRPSQVRETTRLSAQVTSRRYQRLYRKQAPKLYLTERSPLLWETPLLRKSLRTMENLLVQKDKFRTSPSSFNSRKMLSRRMQTSLRTFWHRLLLRQIITSFRRTSRTSTSWIKLSKRRRLKMSHRQHRLYK
jgi:hypothetical protein